jgi:hypothetical protein
MSLKCELFRKARFWAWMIWMAQVSRQGIEVKIDRSNDHDEDKTRAWHCLLTMVDRPSWNLGIQYIPSICMLSLKESHAVSSRIFAVQRRRYINHRCQYVCDYRQNFHSGRFSRMPTPTRCSKPASPPAFKNFCWSISSPPFSSEPLRRTAG